MRESLRERLLKKALGYAWSDFADDVDRSLAPPGQRSMSMEWRIEWIRELSEAVGPISWRDVEIPLLASGWFSVVHRELGYPVDQKAIDEAVRQYGSSVVLVPMEDGE